MMNLKELFNEASNEPIDALDNRIKRYKEAVSLLQDVLKMRNRFGEYTTRQLKAQEARKRANAKKANASVLENAQEQDERFAHERED